MTVHAQRTGSAPTTTEHPNAARMRAAFAAFAAGDLDAVRASMTDDVVWTNTGNNPLAGEHCGWDAVSAMFGTLFEVTGGTFSMEVIDIIASDTHAVAIYDATSTVSGSTQTHRFVLIDEVTSEGKVSATRLLPYDLEAADAHMRGGQ